MKYIKIGVPRKISINKIYYGIREDDFFLYEYSIRKGFEDRTMFNSPHFQFLSLYTQNGNIYNSDYVIWLRNYGRTKDQIKRSIEKFISLYEDCRLNGVVRNITVFADSTNYSISPEDTRPLRDKNNGKFPLYQTRCKDFEILWGHHRAACAAFLGYPNLRCFFYLSVVFWLTRRLKSSSIV